MSDKLIKLSRVVSHALRHAPEEYTLELDPNGWVSIDSLLKALANKNTKWSTLEESDIHAMAEAGEKQRFEFRGTDIRAIYGHSFDQAVAHEPLEPPDMLYHGTTPEFWSQIQQQGLKPMKRQYVHLSPDRETAIEVAKRRTPNPVMIVVNTKQAFLDGVLFYQGNDKVWLAGFVDTKYLSLIEK